MKKYIVLLVAALAFFGVAIYVGIINTPSATLGQSSVGTFFPTVATSSQINVQTSSTSILATSTARIYAVIVNDGSNAVYLGFNGRPAVLGQGIRLNASGGSYEINSLNLYAGAITGIASGGASNVTVMAKQ